MCQGMAASAVTVAALSPPTLLAVGRNQCRRCCASKSLTSRPGMRPRRLLMRCSVILRAYTLRDVGTRPPMRCARTHAAAAAAVPRSTLYLPCHPFLHADLHAPVKVVAKKAAAVQFQVEDLLNSFPRVDGGGEPAPMAVDG